MGLLDEIEAVFNTTDLYKVLKADKKASQAELKKAYFTAARQWHPDKARHETKETATARFQLLSKVHAILNDEESRKVRRGKGAWLRNGATWCSG